MNKFESQSRLLTCFIAFLLSVLAAGCGGGGGDGGRDPILGAGGTPALAPRVTAQAPVANATGVPISTKIITAAFSKAMNPATLTAASFTLACPAGTPVAGTVTYLAAGNVATLTLPAAPNLPPSTLCTATVTTAAMDTAAIPLPGNFVWTFTTGLTPDTTRPRVSLTAPVTTAPGPTLAVPTNSAITAVFTEDMAPATITAAGTFTVTCAAPCVSPSPAGGGATYVVGSRTATYTPTAVLAASTTYTATITTAATDLAGNQLAGNQAALPAASNYVWTFTTAAAAVAPAPVSVGTTNPVAGAAGVCPSATINATFSAPSGLRMDPLTVTAATFTVTGPAPALTPVTAASVVLDVGTGLIATFTPNAPVTAGVTYTATIKGGASGVKDLAIPGNALASDFTWTFGVVACPPPLVPAATPFGVAYPFAIAATAGVTNTATAPITTINGDVVLDPLATCNAVAVGAAGTFGLCGGFPPILNGTVFSPLSPDAGATSAAVKLALRAAYLTITPPAGPPAVGSLGGATDLPAGTTLGAPTGSALVQGDNLFAPGVYRSTTSILITGDVTLDGQGDPNAVFVFQSSSTIGTADGAASPAAHPRILLINGARASNVYWQAATSATLGTFTEWQGNLLASASVTMKTGATSCGRLFAGAFTDGAFVFDSNVISVPDVSC